MVKRGQGTFEYVLLLGGVLLIVVLAVVLLQGTFGTSKGNVNKNSCTAALVQDQTCWTGGAWNPCGGVDGAVKYKDCGLSAAKPDPSCAALVLPATVYCGPNPAGA